MLKARLINRGLMPAEQYMPFVVAGFTVTGVIVLFSTAIACCIVRKASLLSHPKTNPNPLLTIACCIVRKASLLSHPKTNPNPLLTIACCIVRKAGRVPKEPNPNPNPNP